MKSEVFSRLVTDCFNESEYQYVNVGINEQEFLFDA